MEQQSNSMHNMHIWHGAIRSHEFMSIYNHYHNIAITTCNEHRNI